VEELRPEDIAAIYGRFAPGRSLADDFRQRFGEDLDEEALNDGHQIVIVASSLDDSTERIVGYLTERDIPINVLCFQVFAYGTGLLLSRAWLLDPVQTQISAAAVFHREKEPWNGEFYFNFGHGENRSWGDAVQYGFVSAGGGTPYTKPLRLLKSGDRIWVKVPHYGFVGVARVVGPAQPATTFKVATPAGEVPVLEIAKGGKYTREFLNDPERCEYFVPVRWVQTVPLEDAVHEIGLFGIQLIVCKPTTPKWRFTVDRLKEKFPDFDK
jgi:hypothetical protein